MCSLHREPGVQWWQTVAPSVVYTACCLNGLPYRTLDTALSLWHSCVNSCYPQYGFQTGMWGTLGKPQGTIARVHIGQILIIHTKWRTLMQGHSQFPGAARRSTSLRSGSTSHFNTQEFEAMMAEKQFISNTCGGQTHPNHGLLDKWLALCSWEPSHCPLLIHAHQ